jgi:uncharacterized protein YjcR
MIRRNPKVTTTCGRQSVPSRAREAYALHVAGAKLTELADKYGVSVRAVDGWMRAVREDRRDRLWSP